MTIIKSFSVGNGDTFYIKHGSSNFTTIDCCLSNDNREDIVDEIKSEMEDKFINRFISTHPDEDHIQQLDYYDDKIEILNFYCVKNSATKTDETDGFKRYKSLRDGKKASNIFKGYSRKWMNKGGKDDDGDEIGSSGINILWPNTSNVDFKNALLDANDGKSPNNISPIIQYRQEDGVTAIWMGDLETDFMEKILDEVDFRKTNLLFAPHHGRKSGKIPSEWIETMDPDIIIMGEANSNNSDYASYPDRNKIRQNSAKDITFDCVGSKIHCYSSSSTYKVDFLDDEGQTIYDYYIGTLKI